MDSYTITIAPNDDSGAATRLVVDTSGDQVRITDVHLHAPQGLSSGHIPTVDFDLLLQAVTGTVTASNGKSAAGVTELSAPQRSTPALDAATASGLAELPASSAAPKGRARKAALRSATTSPARPARAARTRSATAASGEEATAPRRSARRASTSTAPTGKQAPVKAAGKTAEVRTPPAQARKRTAAAPAKSQAPAKRTRAATTTAGSTTTGRVYRRTPDDLPAVFEQVETVAGVAAHYQVPRHTAQGWVSRLRATA